MMNGRISRMSKSISYVQLYVDGRTSPVAALRKLVIVSVIQKARLEPQQALAIRLRGLCDRAAMMCCSRRSAAQMASHVMVSVQSGLPAGRVMPGTGFT